jgi:hypothetical protein
LFHDSPQGKTIIHMCTDPACGLAGADDVLDHLCARLGIREGETTADGQYTVVRTTCLGQCDHAPSALLSQRGAGEISRAPVTDIARLLSESSAPQNNTIGGERRVLLAHAGNDHHAQTLEAYGDYAALRRAIRNMTPEGVIAEVEASKLIGRGGAAFPTGQKWRFAAREAAQPHYVICNADESEPGTFKDRVLLEGQPHLVLEGMAICGYAVGAQKGYLFVRGEYPEAARRLQTALGEAEAAGLLGANIMGSGFTFRVEVRRGAGAYI